MPRLARVVCPGVPHHVTQRGNRRGRVFFTDDDCRTYLAWLRQYSDKHDVEVLAYCLMTNHVHLVVVPATGHGLHRALKPLHMRHAQRINRTHGWTGHLWQGRYFASALDEQYLWTAIRYVERNPVRANIVEQAASYPWSSAAAHCGLCSDPVLTSIGAWRRQCEALGDWAAWLAQGDDEQGLEAIRRKAEKGLPCGSAAFVGQLEQAVGRSLPDRPQGRPRAGKG